MTPRIGRADALAFVLLLLLTSSAAAAAYEDATSAVTPTSFFAPIPEDTTTPPSTVPASTDAAATETSSLPVDVDPAEHRRILFINSYKLTYARDGSNVTDQLGIDLPERASGVASIDYHPGQRRLYYSTPRAGFWRRNARMYSIPWDYRHDCDGDEHCKVLKDEEIKPIEQTDDGVRKSYRVKDDEVRVLREENYWNPRSLAIDYVNDKLYYVDTADRAVNVVDLDGGDKSSVFEDEPLIPYEVVVDPPEGLMFVLAANTRTDHMQIYRANMDGSDPLLLLDNIRRKDNAPQLRDKVGFSLDALNKRIYFASPYDGFIGSLSYDGEDGAIVAEAKHPTAIGVSNDTLYWFDGDVHSSSLFVCANTACSLNTCQLNFTDSSSSPSPASCISDTITTLIQDKRLDYATHAIKLIDPSAMRQQVENPCGKDNGGCEQHCLLKKVVSSSDADGYYESETSLGYGCACNAGWWLKRDRRGCTRELMTYTYDNFYVPNLASLAELYDYNNEDSASFYPISRDLLVRLSFSRADAVFVQEPSDFITVDESGRRLRMRSMLEKDALSDSAELDELWSRLGLNRLDVKDDTDSSGEDVKIYDGNKTIGKAVTYDWITKNLYYYVLTNKTDEVELFVLKYDRPDRIRWRDIKEKYSTKPEKSLGRIPAPTFMAIHPYSGYVFAALRNGSIVRFNTDGGNATLLVNVGNAGNAVAVDFTDDRLYFVDTEGYINHAKLDGSDIKKLNNTVMPKIDFMYIYDRWIYARSEDDRLYRIDKISGRESATLEISPTNFLHESVGVKVRARDAGYVNGFEHPCVETSGCDNFCFAVMDEETMELRKVCA